MDDTNFNLIQRTIRNLAKEVVIATLGMIQDEKLDPEIQYGWIKKIQEANDEEMPDVIESIQRELKLHTVDTNIVN